MPSSLRVLTLFLLSWLLAGVVRAQAGAAVGQTVDSVQLARSAWTQADLQAWWTALRRREQGAATDAGLVLPAHLLPPDEAAAWQAVRLPDVRAPFVSGAGPDPAPIQMRWYRLQLPAAPQARGLYLPRLVVLSAAVLCRQQGGWRLLRDNQPSKGEYWAQALWSLLPEAGPLEVVLALPVRQGAPYAVAPLRVGPRDQLEPTWRRRVWLQSGLPQAISFTLAVLGLLSLALWVKLRSESGYALFALGAGLWLLRNLHHYVDPPTAPWAAEWFWWMTHASLSWILLLVFVFALRFARVWPGRLLRGLVLAVVLATVLGLPLWLKPTDRMVLQYLVTTGVGLVSVTYLNWLGWREREGAGRVELRIIGAALLLGLVLGAHDLSVLAGWAWTEDIYLMPFAALAMMLSFLYVVQRRYAGRVEQAMFQNSQLQQSLDVQADALALQVKRLQEAERQQALLLERQRLMADMHDGLGSSLLSALVAVEQGNLSQDKVVEVLRECVDDLRLVIDSLEPVGHDLVSLLATMRYRLGKRLHAGGLTLEWDVQDLPQLPWLEPPDALHVLRLMQEALNNVVKHAKATRVRMVTRDHGSHVEIRVEDDGEGFEVQSIRHGRGLKSQVKRAQRLGGKLRIESTPGVGTRLSLRLPVERKEAPDPQARA